MKNQIQLPDHFTYGRLIRFTLPSMGMMVFTSIYGVVDGFFVSNFAGKTPFAALNLIMPFLMILSTVGLMFGTGGTAIVAKTFGEGDREKGNRYFSLFVYTAGILGVAFAVLGFLFLPAIAALLGAEGEMLKNAVLYGRIILLALPFNTLQLLFQSFCVTAEKPKLGLGVTVLSGITNMVLDAVLVISLPQEYKLAGAAVATALSQVVGGGVPLLYFARKNSSILRLGKCRFDGRILLRACVNGSSEFMSNISMNLVGMLYNLQLLHYAGEDGVAAYGVMMYVSMIFSAAFIGYSIGIAPVVGYHDGAKKTQRAAGTAEKKSADDRHVRGGYGGCRRGAGVAAGAALCGLRPRADAADGGGLPHFRTVLFLHGLRHIQLRLFHRSQRRRYLRHHLLPADAGVSGGCRAAAVQPLGHYRHLDLHYRGEIYGRAPLGAVSHDKKKKVSLLGGLNGLTNGQLWGILTVDSLI